MRTAINWKGKARDLKNRARKPKVELVGPQGQFRIVYRPETALRGGFGGDVADRSSGRYLDDRFQTDVVVVEDAVTGDRIGVVDDQQQAHALCKAALRLRQPKPAALARTPEVK